ncbi:MAG: helix-turn-helix domain-containing protein [Opitutaceae bacterium]|nr:helix-turn-helix domain-containing protein [Opitutaceae bacterium]
MSHLSDTLAELLDIEEMSQSELAGRVKTDRGTISRFCNARLSPTREMLARMVGAVSVRKERRLKLLLAHLQDEAAACACLSPADYIIAPAASDSPVAGIPVSMQESMGVLLRAVAGGGHPELCTLLQSLARMVAAGENRPSKNRRAAGTRCRKTGRPRAGVQ